MSMSKWDRWHSAITSSEKFGIILYPGILHRQLYQTQLFHFPPFHRILNSRSHLVFVVFSPYFSILFEFAQKLCANISAARILIGYIPTTRRYMCKRHTGNNSACMWLFFLRCLVAVLKRIYSRRRIHNRKCKHPVSLRTVLHALYINIFSVTHK